MSYEDRYLEMFELDLDRARTLGERLREVLHIPYSSQVEETALILAEETRVHPSVDLTDWAKRVWESIDGETRRAVRAHRENVAAGLTEFGGGYVDGTLDTAKDEARRVTEIRVALALLFIEAGIHHPMRDWW